MKYSRNEAMAMKGVWAENGDLKRVNQNGFFNFGNLKVSKNENEFLLEYNISRCDWNFENFRELVAGTSDHISWKPGKYIIETSCGGESHKTLSYEIAENKEIKFLGSVNHQAFAESYAFFAPGRWLRD